MRNIALIIVVVLALNGVSHTVQGPQRSEPAPAEHPLTLRSEGQPAETPLVEKLLPQEPAAVKDSLTTRDGQLSPGGNFRYSAARNIWVPVDKGNRQYRLNGGGLVTAAHLIAEHGHHPACANQWTRLELEIAHANDHAAQRAKASRGHWEIQQVCGRRGCNNVRVWVQD